ncbi:hypothetical protein [Hymenobacter cavernae]|uniref:Uncharacterized protein n=1 Tax=Hymenobacter cavernae TaxID=2044852 RepID=A0ABQ1TW96_9BACT|nr:hypothetical protein [Hymenobacter cavernae]GGF05314.1 hypothetical protein GCM10011383_15560 [Hymenobacter cavernae]
MSKQSGKRSQHDPKAGPNANSEISNQSSEKAQHAGSTDHDRSVRSGLSGQASQPHIATDENLQDRVAGDMESGTGMTAPTEKGQASKNGDRHG